MATKLELEAELDQLRAQNDMLRSQANEARDSVASNDPPIEVGVAENLKRVLDEHGLDSDSVEALRGQLTDEFTHLQKEYPLAILLGVFALGCVVGRAFK